MTVLTAVLTWLRKRIKAPASPLHVMVYTRRDCRLCEEALGLLRREQRTIGFQLEVTDVDAVPALQQQYGDCVPVVLVDGKLRFRGRINLILLRRLFQASSRLIDPSP